MKLFIYIQFMFFLPSLWEGSGMGCSAQTRLILNNDIYMVFKNNIELVVDNSAANAITTLGTGGNIISEAEFNRVKWNIVTAIGIYTIPFTKSPGNKIPVTVNITTAGAGSGSILFSTYGGATWDNSTYMPLGPPAVTNMGDINGANIIKIGCK